MIDNRFHYRTWKSLEAVNSVVWTYMSILCYARFGVPTNYPTHVFGAKLWSHNFCESLFSVKIRDHGGFFFKW